MTITLISAVSENGVIGRDGDLPWSLRDDMKWFMHRTKGATVIMGRRTYESMDAALPGRQNIVLTRNTSWSAPDAITAPTIKKAIKLAEHDEIFIIGGQAVYAAGLPFANRIDLTRVHAQVEGDARFPEMDWTKWERQSAEEHRADDRNDHNFTIEVWKRIEP